jgi:hypothetical protein
MMGWELINEEDFQDQVQGLEYLMVEEGSM